MNNNINYDRYLIEICDNLIFITDKNEENKNHVSILSNHLVDILIDLSEYIPEESKINILYKYSDEIFYIIELDEDEKYDFFKFHIIDEISAIKSVLLYVPKEENYKVFELCRIKL